MKVYTDLELIRQNADISYATFFYPYLGAYPEPLNGPQSPMSSRFDLWCRESNLFQLSDLDRCDVAVFPFEFYGIVNHPGRDDMLSAFVHRAAMSGKHVVLFAYGDEYVDFPEYDALFIVQSNLKKSSMSPKHFSMPNFVEDLFAIYVKKTPKRSSSRPMLFRTRHLPTISFCGYAESTAVRKEVVEHLLHSKYVQQNFVLRDQYFGGAWDSRRGGYDFKKLKRVRAQYVKNLISSDYVLCVRGYGNYSSRIYEALCCGKIPVLVNTDCVLPFDADLDYSSCFLIIDSADIDSLGEVIFEYDLTLSDEEFYEKQLRCRQLWLDYLSPQGFYRNFIACLSKRIALNG